VNAWLAGGVEHLTSSTKPVAAAAYNCKLCNTVPTKCEACLILGGFVTQMAKNVEAGASWHFPQLQRLHPQNASSTSLPLLHFAPLCHC